MRYRRVGRSGLRVSTVGLGSWLTLGHTVSLTASERLVRGAVDLGVNLLDTADVYARGEAEATLGRAIEGLRREHLVLASKCFFPMSEDVNDRGLSRKHVMESLHGSLRRLGTDYLDLYQCHRPDAEVTLEETAMAMDDAIRAGKVLYWGVSCWPAHRIARVAQMCRERGLHPPISNQPPYNLLAREIEREVVPGCAEVGVGQVVYSPLAQGVLTGKYRRGQPPPAGSRATDERANMFLGNYLTEENLEKVETLVEIARRLGRTPGQVALAWCLRLSEVSSVLVGARDLAQLEENVAAADLDLPEDVLGELDERFPL